MLSELQEIEQRPKFRVYLDLNEEEFLYLYALTYMKSDGKPEGLRFAFETAIFEIVEELAERSPFFSAARAGIVGGKSPLQLAQGSQVADRVDYALAEARQRQE